MANAGLPVQKLVNVNISLQAASVSRLAFGVPFIWDTQNILGSGTSGDVNGFSSLSELSAAGYPAWSATYKMATALLQQQPHVVSFQVGSIDTTGKTTAECLDQFVAIAPNQFYALLLADPTRDSTLIEEASAWCELQDNSKFLFAAQGASVAGTVGQNLYDLQSVQTSFWATGEQAQVKLISISGTFAMDAAATVDLNGTSYGPAATLSALASAIAAAPEVASAVADGPTNTITVTAAAPLVDLFFSNYAGGGTSPTTAKFATVTASDGPVDAAACGRILPLGAGEATLGEKTLAGILPLPLTTSQANQAEALRVNYYAKIGGRNMTYPGTCSADIASGVPLWADLVFGAAAFKADLNTALLDYLLAGKKVPYNDQGIAGAVAAIAAVAKNYVGKGYLEPFDQKTAITFPLASQVPPGDKSLRVLNGISANFTATGAIQQLGDVSITINA